LASDIEKEIKMQLLDIAVTKVDTLGMLLAQIADLEAQAEAIKAELKQEEGHIEGNLYKVCVTLSQRKTVDNKAVFAEANVPAELIEKHTKTSAVITLKVTAR
jgi:cell division ATPase FtsA